MRYSRLLIGLALIILALWVIVGEQMSGASANAVVNAPISTVRAPVTGKITLRDRPLGSAINRQEEMGSVVGTMVDDVRLNDLIMEQAFAAAEIEHARARLAALESQIEGLSERRDVFQRKRLEELTTLLSHARTRLQLLQDTAPDDGPETVLSGQGQPASEGTSRVAGIAVDLAQERIDELEIALNAATSGVFLGDGFNDAPYSEQYRTTLFTEQDRLTADMALAEARLAAIAARIGRERLRQNLLGAAAMESTVNGQLWDVLAADGEIVERGQDVLRLADCDRAIVTLSVSENIYNRLKIGDAATFRLSEGGRVLAGTITRMAGSGAATVYQNLAVAPSQRHLERFDVALLVPDLRNVADLRCSIGQTGRAFFETRPLDWLRGMWN